MSQRPRRWLELSARCLSAGEREALLPEALVALGGRGAEERAGWFVTYLTEPTDAVAFTERARTALEDATGLSGVEVRTAWRDDQDWAETWKRGLGPRRVTERILVRPSWARDGAAGPAEIVIVIDPGMAFGTAEHGTTRGCLRLLDGRVRPGERVLDVGAGSGILSVAMARLGAHEVVAAECDPLAHETLVENVERNGVAERVRCVHALVDAGWLAAHGTFDGVAANLQRGILDPLAAPLAAALADHGWLVVSGILEEEWPATVALLKRVGCECMAVDADGEWRSGLFRRGAVGRGPITRPDARPPGGSRAPRGRSRTSG